MVAKATKPDPEVAAILTALGLHLSSSVLQVSRIMPLAVDDATVAEARV